MTCMHTRTLKNLLAPSLLTLAMFAGATQAAAPLRPPQGYFAPIEKMKTGDSSEGCDAMPAPYTGSLQFRSKYEGSDKARSTLNVQSEKAFRDSTADITKLERGTSKRVMQFMRDGRPEQLECTLNWLTAWAKADAILARAKALLDKTGYRKDHEPVNEGSRRLLSLAAKGDRLDKRLWTGIAGLTGAKGNSTALVGTPDQVADALLDYYDIGVRTFLIRGFDPLADAVAYGRDLLPRVRELVAERERRAVAAE